MIEILEELTNRDYLRAQVVPYVGYGPPVPHQVPYTNLPSTVHNVPYANTPYGTYVTPYSPYSITGPENVAPQHVASPVINNAAQVSEDSNTLASQQVSSNQNPDETTFAKPPEHERVHGMISVDSSTIKDSKDTGKGSEASSLPLGLLDGFLTLANGGKLPGPPQTSNSSAGTDSKRNSISVLSAPPSPDDTIDEPAGKADTDILALVDYVAKMLGRSNDYPPRVHAGVPLPGPFAALNAQQLGAELRRLTAVAEPEINIIVPYGHAHAAYLFHLQLEARVQYLMESAINAAYANACAPQHAVDQWGRPMYQAPNPASGGQAISGQWYNQHSPTQQLSTMPPPPPPSKILKSNAAAISPVAGNTTEEREPHVYEVPVMSKRPVSKILKSNAAALPPVVDATAEEPDVYEVPTTPERPKIKLRISFNKGKKKEE